MHEPPAPPPPGTRLNGWKDIANHLGKGVRTVQRWEKVYGLPIHRIGQDGGDIVFAFAPEIERWLADFERQRLSGAIREEPSATIDAKPADVTPFEATSTTGDHDSADAGAGPPPSPPPDIAPRGRRWWMPLLAACASVAVVAAGGLAWSRSAATRANEAQPAAWRVEADTLVILDARGRECWRRPFPIDLVEEHYNAPSPSIEHLPIARQPVIIVDLEGDGTREVVFAVIAEPAEGSPLYVFDHDGRVRFEHRRAPTMTFGDTRYAPPWFLRGVTITTTASGDKSIWAVFIHHLWFPTVLDQLAPDGTLRSSYVSNGYISSIDAGTWRGGPAIFVGATSNETRGASLAIFSGTGVRGSAPAANEAYRCVDCPTGAPDAFVVFPRSCLRTLRDDTSDVTRTWEDGTGRLTVMVQQGREPVPPSTAQIPVPVYYEIDRDLGRAGVEVSREFRLMHDAVRQQGRLDHDIGERDRALMLPVRRWEDGRLVPLAPGEFRR
ncbi:MAG: hypothetical protein JNM38_23885 [Acidobacteria bacterium]|nr:hypothetical protein [Acidobacteriota bacterium]